MLRSKKDVDRHVRDILSKVSNETERKLRGYNVARFYHNVGEHDIARRYLGQFLSVRPKSIDAHRLLGQIYEASGNEEKAVLAYKTAYELSDGQKDLVVKICELYCSVPCEVSVLMHWAEEGQRLCPHHEAVTKLRSTIIANSSDSNSRTNLQDLYLDQIKVNPTSAELQSNLVRLYLDWSTEDPRKLDEAYSYVSEVEARRPFTHSLLWYQTLLQVADCYEKQGGRTQPLGVEFHSWVVTALDRLVHLTLTAASSSAVSSTSDSNRESYLTDAANLLQRFDNKLAAVKKMNCSRELEQAMSGQLVFHVAQFVMVSAKRTNALRNPNLLSCLLLHACVGPLPDRTSHPYFHKLACYRMSQSYHILHSVARDSGISPSTLLNKVRQQCSNRESKEEAFRAVFGSRVSADQSYFLHHSGYGEQELTIPSADAAAAFDQVVSTTESSQLREIVWLYLQGILRRVSSPTASKNASLNLSNLNTSLNSSAITSGSNNANLNSLVNSALKKNQPYYPYKLFDGLQFATSHLNSAVPDSLCHLDLLAFLAATIFCELENGVCSGSVRSAVCKTSVCSGWLLHTPQQEEWWNSAHDLFVSSSRRSALAKGVGKCRQTVQRGLEAVRLLATGGVSVPLAVHIAQCFTHWASSATDDADVSISEVTALEERAEHCWQRVLSMCGKGKVSTPSSVHTPRNQLFSTTRHDLSTLKLEEIEEEGQLFLAKRLIKAGRRQEALQALGQLRSPEASFQRAMVYKQQANEMANAVSGELKLFTNEQRGQHTLYLTQARDTLYLTLDRLRMPGVDRNHPLNAALSTEMTNVERALSAITSDIINASFHDGDGESEPEPLSPIRHNLHDTSVGGESLLNGNNYNTATPARGHRVTSSLRLEARPSPERLDAQVRHLASVQEQTLQNLCEQNAALRNQNSALRDTCNAVSSQVKENAHLFRTILENNKSLSLDCYYNILTEIKTVSSAMKDLQDDVQKLKQEVSEMKAASNKRHDETDGRIEGLPAHPTPPPHQSVLSQLYMGCYGGQVGATGVPHPLAPHLLPPHSSMLPVHAGHGSPFLPPATLAESAYLSGSNAAGLHVPRVLGGVSAASTIANMSTSSPSVTRGGVQELASASVTPATTPAGLLPAPFGVSSAGTVGSDPLSGMLSAPYGASTSTAALPGLLTAATSGSLTAPATAPHNYQIPLPVASLAGVAPFPRQGSDRPSSMIPTAGLLASVPPPIYSAVTPENSPLSASQHAAAAAAAAAASTSLASTTSQQTMFLSGSGLAPVSTSLATTPLALTGKIKSIPQRDAKQTEVSELSSGAADLSVLSNASNEYYHDDGHDPYPDFVPVVPLPAKVEVCTGEEDEQVLFEDRARLYRMCSKEWKERGTGVIKILHNSPKKTVRVLMRRDQTYKICANHFITPSLKLKKLQKNDNVWLWAAQDFADEELTNETFCCKFKTVEVATRFSRAITEAKMLASDYLKEATTETPVKTPPPTTKPLSELFKKAPGSWTCSTCCVVNTAAAASCIACSTANPNAPTSVAESATPSSNSALDLSASAGGGFKFGLSTATSAATPVFSSLPPAKGSGSITFGISGQATVSKGSPFSTPTPALFSTPVSKTVFSAGLSKDDTPNTLFVTPTSNKSEQSSVASSVLTSALNTPSQTSLFSTPLQVSASPAISASFGIAFTTSSSAGNTTTAATTPASTPSLFGTPVTSTKFSITPSASGMFAPASSALTTSTAASTAPVATATPTSSQSKTLFGGFSFTSTPSIAAPKEEKEVKKEEAPKKPSIFSTFTFSSNPAEGSTTSPFTFKKDDASSTTGNAGSFFANFKANDTLTFGAVAGESSNLGASDVFKKKDADAFKPQPLFAGNTSKNSTTANESAEKVEEFEPEVHFEPVIPLPELVQVKTGEEDEDQLFCERAKLLRFANATKEWKERGLGDIKILSNKSTGKYRVLMRREKTLKICANHYITPDLSISFGNDSDKALLWAVNDYADGEMAREVFCVRFKTPELASAFKQSFEKAQKLLRDQPSAADETKPPESNDSKTASLMDKFKPAAGSWECDTCLLRNKPDALTCASCQALKPGASAADVATTSANATSSFSFGIKLSGAAATSAASGFSASSFTFGNATGSTPAFSFGLPASTSATSAASSTTPSTSVASTNFSFKPAVASKDASATGDTKAQSGFKFGSPEKFEFSFKPRPPRSRDTSHCESEDGVVEEDEGDHLYFEPVVPLPDKVDVVTGEEDEEVMYCHRAKLFRKVGPEWKERGLGDIKVLRHRLTRRVRLLMRREQVYKICLNHYLTENIKFNDKDEKSFYWVAQDYSEETPALETFAIRFKTSDIAQEFKKAAAAALTCAPAPSGRPGQSAAPSGAADAGTEAAAPEASGVTRARQLLLPDDFYAFENSGKECSGCIGCKVETLPPFLQLETPSGNVLKDFPRDDLPRTPSFTAQSVFGSKASDSIPSKPLFGSTPTVSSASLSFGSAPSRSLFGGAQATDAPKSNLFGGPSVSSLFGGGTSSVFGGASASPTSVFGGAGVGGSQASIFGGASSGAEKPSIFGSASSGTEKLSIFGGASSGAEKPSIFSSASSGAEKPSIFANTSSGTEKTSIFGGAGSGTEKPSIFASTSSGAEKPSLFGGASTTTSTTSLFGGAASGTTTSAGSSLFGATNPSGTTSLFGGAGLSSSTSLFGGSPAANSAGSLFGGNKTTTSQPVFGEAPKNFPSPSLGGSNSTVFGATAASSEGSKSSGSVFDKPAVSSSTSTTVNSNVTSSKLSEGSAPSGGGLFGGSLASENKGFISFADVTAGQDGFKSKASSVDMSAWQAKPLFSSLNKSNNQSKDDSSDQLHNEDDSHDPHFEPVIPMPDLVEVKTGEENLEVIYSHRSKTFRYDNNTKEWKERGLGDIKILYDPATQKYRLLQRREQIHKLAVHHYLMPGQKLTPLASSETAWCWYAQDFSEDPQGSREQLAAKFKNAEIANAFKAKFEECIAKVEQQSTEGRANPTAVEKSNSGSSTVAQTASVGIVQSSDRFTKPQQYNSDTESSETGDEDDDDEDEDDDGDDDEYVDSSIMFEKACQLEKRLGENWDMLGTVILRIVYESDSDGARLMATDDGDLLLLDHILSADLTYEDLEGTAVAWDALDLSTQPACQVKLRATFNDDDDKEIFIGTLEEGREFAPKDGTTDEDVDADDAAVACDPALASAISEMLFEMKK